MGSRIIVALDFPDADSAYACAKLLSPRACKVKVGKELFTAEGPAVVEVLVRRGFEVFLDLKFHDIPNTVAGACKAAANLGAWMLNVHSFGGAAMMQAARDALGHTDDRPLLIAVTVLTSLGDADLRQIGIDAGAQRTVLNLADLARANGVDGVVCSAHEAASIRDRFGEAFLRVTPGIRLAESASDDQRRIMSPSLAMRSGASYLVIGRPITRAQDPSAVLRRIEAELGQIGEAH
ncbi:MAG: orotidine-5'-phosphate decarboxylase [Burkholderiales bacterium]|nr:orotidine-5'-phosphate decarboxylase [Burkholderiales bacterium]